MRFIHKISFFSKLYRLLPIHIVHHPFFNYNFNTGSLFNSLFLLGFRKDRLVFSFSNLFYYFLRIKFFFSRSPAKSFIVVSTNELTYFLSKSVFRANQASCIFAPRLGFLTNAVTFLSSNRVSENKINCGSFFLLYLGRGGLINVLKEALILDLPVFAIVGSFNLLNDIDYPLFGSQSSIKAVYFYCSFISFVYRLSS